MRILLTGAGGQLGYEVEQRLAASRYEFQALNHTALDIADARAVQRVLGRSGADLIINAAAYTAVDRAEQEPDIAFAVNRDGPAHLADCCAMRGIPLFHISTDFIFDGVRAGAYREDDPASPLGIYGLSKWRGEEAVRRVLSEHVIMRVSWVFGAHGQNFVKTILRLARQRPVLRVVADQHGCPTYAGDIADTLLLLLDRFAETGKLPWGTYHYAGSPATTWYGFARSIVDRARTHEDLEAREIVPITTAEYPTPAKRPANSRLDCGRLQSSFGIEPCSWHRGLAAVLKSECSAK